ncbi:MAG: hypothetical protein IJC46_03450 [Clostridia bacterium]|nr:hypothetical protein [Clostridia bacterium]
MKKQLTLKSVLLIVIATVVATVGVIGGTYAFLTSTDSDVNTMTLGKVEIVQLEKERVDMTQQDQQTPADLQDYVQNKKLMPAAYIASGKDANDPAAWAPGVAADEAYVNFGALVTADVNAPYAAGVWDSALKGVQDKFVFVENTGNDDVYYRTIFLYEYDETKATNAGGQGMIHFNLNNDSRFDWAFGGEGNIPETVTVNGEVYGVMVATYNVPLKPGTVSRPSLLQVGMDGAADAAVVSQFGATYDVIALSQAVQTAGFESVGAETALKAGFGDITAANLVEWFENLV